MNSRTKRYTSPKGWRFWVDVIDGKLCLASALPARVDHTKINAMCAKLSTESKRLEEIQIIRKRVVFTTNINPQADENEKNYALTNLKNEIEAATPLRISTTPPQPVRKRPTKGKRPTLKRRPSPRRNQRVPGRIAAA